jgi:Protein of unknown function (DUF3147)
MSDPASQGGPRKNHFVPRFQPGRIKEARYRDMAVRFVFGGTISVVAALVGAAFTEPIGGIFTAFPAILVASLTLIDKQEDREHASYDAVGAAMGAVGFIACAFFVSLTLERWPVAASLGVGLSIWLVVSVGLYALYALVAFQGHQDEG